MRRSLLSATLAILAAGPALADAPRVVADIPPVHSLVAAVMGDLGAPSLLLGRGADAHDYQMRPSEARSLARADLVVWIGPEMTPWLGRAIGGDAPARSLELLATPGTRLMPAAEAAQDAGDGHDHAAGADPHAFLDPGNAAVWLDAIADRLALLDPADAAAYRANAAAEKARIAALDAAVSARLAPFGGKPIVVFHEAFGYFAAHYGLTLAGSIAMGDAAEPGAARLSEIRERLRGAACIFPEAGHDLRLVEALAEGTGARIGPPLDPEGRGLEPGAGLYPGLLEGLADGVAACLGGA